MKRDSVLITDGEERAALATVRSLGRAGYRVYVLSISGESLAGASRFAVSDHVLPSPLADPHAYVDGVVALCQRLGIDHLLPISEAALLAILPRRGQFVGVNIPFADDAVFRAVSDKSNVAARAQELGIAVPTLARVEDAQELALLRLPDEIRGPLVLKPIRSVVDMDGERRKTSVAYLPTVGELIPAAHRLPPEAFPLLVQRRVVGPGIGIFLLFWEGRILARFAHRRLREKPPSGGVSVFRESVSAPEALFERSAALLRSFGWTGVAMVEFKLDLASGEYHLMEINGRLWGSLQLAIDAGVDFPLLLLEAASGQPRDPVLRYKVGVRTRWALGDLDHLLARFRHSRKTLGLPPEAPGPFGAFFGFLKDSLPPVRGEVFRVADPGPGTRELRAWFSDVFGW